MKSRSIFQWTKILTDNADQRILIQFRGLSVFFYSLLNTLSHFMNSNWIQKTKIRPKQIVLTISSFSFHKVSKDVILNHSLMCDFFFFAFFRLLSFLQPAVRFFDFFSIYTIVLILFDSLQFQSPLYFSFDWNCKIIIFSWMFFSCCARDNMVKHQNYKRSLEKNYIRGFHYRYPPLNVPPSFSGIENLYLRKH